MWLVNRADVGAVAYGRLQRDGAIRTLIPGVALPSDVPDSPALRRHVLREYFPPGCQVTGLGVLWVHGHTPLPATLNIRAPKGRHVRNWNETLPLVYHAVGELSPDPHDDAFVSLAPAIADALRWAPLDLAVPAAVSALSQAGEVLTDEVAAAVAGQLADAEVVRAAWASVRGALADAA